MVPFVIAVIVNVGVFFLGRWSMHQEIKPIIKLCQLACDTLVLFSLRDHVQDPTEKNQLTDEIDKMSFKMLNVAEKFR